MKAKDIREKSETDLAELEKSLTGEAFQARFKNFTNRLDDTSALKKTRRDIARVKTILTERAKKSTAAPAKVAAPAAKKAVKQSAKKSASKKSGEASK